MALQLVHVIIIIIIIIIVIIIIIIIVIINIIIIIIIQNSLVKSMHLELNLICFLLHIICLTVIATGQELSLTDDRT